MSKRWSRILALASLMALAAVTHAWATDYYVDPLGNDGNDGLTPGTAKLTINAAIGVASATDVIHVAAGTYNEAVVIDKSLSLLGAGEVATILDGTGLGSPVRGITINTGITSVTIKDLTVRNYAANSPNSYAGIYATGPGNDGLVVENVTIKDNVGGSGFYANGPVNGVTLNNLDVSGHTNVAGAARGIVIWNGLKQNITITNCDVYNNNCCGIELQDGTASGVTLSNNNIHDNGDNGIGLVGLQGPGENVVSGNTVTNNGRFGIEIKNPNGSGADTGPGRVVVESNSVTRTLAIADARDIVGIAAFRRGVLAGNVDVPNGAVIRNNTVSGYVQPSTSDGFGIVAEGTNHTVTGNNVTGNDVGIQRQKGHLPYPGDGDQSNLADTYFGRGNSPEACNIVVSGNTLANTVDTRDVPLSAGTGLVTNLNTLATYCTIQAAVNAASPGDVLSAGAGTYNEAVVIDKSLTLQGASETTTILDGTGLASPVRGITINTGVTNVTIEDLTVRNYTGNSPNSYAGVYATGPGNDGLIVRDVTIKDNVGGSGFYANGPVNGVTLDNLDVSGHTNVAGAARGIVIWNGLKQNISITNCDVYNNNCCGIELQDGTASGVTLSNNNIHDNGDNGIGLVGLQGPGENVVSGNTLVNNGRFGIEIKNPNGSGADTGPGRVVVENNDVSRTVAIVDARDIVGIAAFRRGVLAGNVDVPNGAVIRNNTVSGYVQPSTSDGFGIVAEGTNHSITGNTVSGNDVGIQRQKGHLPYPGDGDQSNLADQYFGRGNSPVACGITVSGNTLSNTVDTRDVPLSAGAGIVTNLNTLATYCTIQAAVNAASPGDVISAGAGTYNETVVIDKSLTLQGASETTTILDGTGLGSPVRGITINTGVTNVTIKDLTVRNYAANSPNSYAGVYATGPGNDGLVVENVTIKDNVGGSGFYANGPVNGVTLNNLDVSGHTNVAGAARGIVIWNGLKQNITITNCDVYNNNCCGIELQDGTASGVTLSNNNVHDNGDNGIGLVGLQGPGENVVSNNTVTDNGRFGIEIKNPNGSGADTGPGRVVVEQNTVSRTVPIVDARDIAGIAAFRRGVLAGNVDVPNGVWIEGNTVSGYVQPSTSDGFGIVAEGTNHTVTGNNVTGNDVGIQRQRGHLPYPGDGDQSNLADQYFGRGNSPVACAITVSGNTLSNTVDTRDVPVALNAGVVTNTNTAETFCSIQAAIDDANTVAGHTIQVGAGTYDEQVIVHKGVAIVGAGAPVVQYTGTVSGKPTLFDVSADDAVIDGIHCNVDLSRLRSAVIVSGAAIDQISVRNNVITGFGAPAGSFGDRNAISVNYGGPTNYRVATGGVDAVIVTNNTVGGTLPTGFFRAGVATDESGGTFSGNTMQTISHDVLARFGSNGDIEITNNTFNGGGVELADMNAGAGTLTVENNDFDGTFNQVASPNSALLRIKNNYHGKATHVLGNTFVNSAWSASLENYNTVEVSQNDFTPPASSTTYHHVTVNTKSISTNSAAIVQVPVSATVTRNYFRGSGSVGGSGVTFLNHDSDAANIGAMVVNENSFDLDVQNAIEQDGQSGNTTGATFPNYTALIGAGAGAQTTMAPWTAAIDGTCNWYGTTDHLAVATRVGPDVDHDPYLFSGVDNEPGTAGFQPVPNACMSPDLECPVVTVISPNGGPPPEIFVVGSSAKISWNATDNVGVTSIDIEVSRDLGGTWEPIADGLPNSGTYHWVVTGPPTFVGVTPEYKALVKITARDAFDNECYDESNNPFAIFDLTTSTLVATFEALPMLDGIRLRWGFAQPELLGKVALERATAEHGPWTVVQDALVAGGRTAEFVDRDVEAGQTYHYRLSGTIRGGATMTFGRVVVVAGAAIESIELASVAPNPTSGPTTIDFALPRAAQLRLAVLDVQGREIALLANGAYEPGRHQVTWSGRTERGPAQAGVYFVRFEAEGKVFTRRLALTR